MACGSKCTSLFGWSSSLGRRTWSSTSAFSTSPSSCPKRSENFPPGPSLLNGFCFFGPLRASSSARKTDGRERGRRESATSARPIFSHADERVPRRRGKCQLGALRLRNDLATTFCHMSAQRSPLIGDGNQPARQRRRVCDSLRLQRLRRDGLDGLSSVPCHVAPGVNGPLLLKFEQRGRGRGRRMMTMMMMMMKSSKSVRREVRNAQVKHRRRWSIIDDGREWAGEKPGGGRTALRRSWKACNHVTSAKGKSVQRRSMIATCQAVTGGQALTAGSCYWLHDAPTEGGPTPLGASASEGGVNFSVFSSGATAVSLCLFTEDDLQRGQVTEEIQFDPNLNRTGQIWHVFVPNLAPNLLYGFRMDGCFCPEESERYDPSQVLVDPYAKVVVSRPTYGPPAEGTECWPQMAGAVPDLEADVFDWEGDTSPSHHMKDLVIYELHVRGFTRHPSSKTQAPRGTYLSLIEKIPHLKELGVNAIELLPVHEFNELEYFSHDSTTGGLENYRINFWGYSTINFFSPMTRYAAAGISDCGRNAIKEFKTLVKECHKAGIEVILDVVFNHTAEGNEKGPTISFRGLDNKVFYMTSQNGDFYNYSGCGNTFNCNHPMVRQFIVDCLRYWVLEMHVDGFRFDLASILTRSCSMWESREVYAGDSEENIMLYGGGDGGGDDLSFDMRGSGGGGGGGEEGGSDFIHGLKTGTPLSRPPLIDMICNDGVLKGTKLIAEAWDCGGLYQVGSFPHQGIWAEWNGKFRDCVRMFVKGTDGLAGDFANYLSGSPHLYSAGGRKPYHSINFVTSHDGFTLLDLVSYNEKHNLANGENNNDGDNHNMSWNCGAEGELAEEKVLNLRQRQIRNFVLALMVSKGVPMITMGDEYGHSKGGNNNTYCHDSDLNYFRWDEKEVDPGGFYRFFRLVTNLRGEWEVLRAAEFENDDRLEWHGHYPCSPDWSFTSRFVAFTLRDEQRGELYVAFNASHLPRMVELPQREGRVWETVVDTSKLPPYDFLDSEMSDSLRDAVLAQSSAFLTNSYYPMIGYSSVLLKLVQKKKEK